MNWSGPCAVRGRWRTTGVALLAAGLLASCTSSGDGGTTSTQTNPDSLGNEQFSFLSGLHQVEDNLTQALLAHDENGFLAQFTGTARTAARTWWTNQNTIGFSVGAASVEQPEHPEVQPKGGVATIDAVVSLATHTRSDPTDDENKPAVAGWRYTLTLRTDSRSKAPTVVRMVPTVGPGPWDGPALHVARAGNVIVAGPAAEHATVDRYAGLAKVASDWIYAFARRDHQGLIDQQHGFVVFVSGDKALRNRWFHAASTKQKGWVPDAAGYEMPMAEPTIIGHSEKIAHTTIGGERIVAAPVADAHMAERTLVHEMAHALIEEFGGGFSPKRPPLWTVEGFARFVDTVFDTHGPDGKGTFTGGTAADVREAVRTGFFSDTPPQDSVVYQGTAKQGNYAYDLGASAFAYLAEKYGPTIAIKAAMYAYTEGRSAFASVVATDSSHAGTTELTFMDEGTVTRAWAQWVRATFG